MASVPIRTGHFHLMRCGRWRHPKELIARPRGRRRSPLSLGYRPEIAAEDVLISNPTLVRLEHTIEASADFVVPAGCRRVFLASHRRDVPRWWTGSSPQIAADWLIENNRLYAYAGEGTDWTWTPSGQVTFETLGKRTRWRLETDRLGLDADIDPDAEAEADAAFHVCAPGHREYSAVTSGCRSGHT